MQRQDANLERLREELFALGEDKEAKNNAPKHAQYEEIDSKVKQFLNEILGYVNNVEHATIKKKL